MIVRCGAVGRMDSPIGCLCFLALSAEADGGRALHHQAIREEQQKIYVIPPRFSHKSNIILRGYTCSIAVQTTAIVSSSTTVVVLLLQVSSYSGNHLDTSILSRLPVPSI